MTSFSRLDSIEARTLYSSKAEQLLGILTDLASFLEPATLCLWKWATNPSIQAISCNYFAFLVFIIRTDLDSILELYYPGWAASYRVAVDFQLVLVYQ